MNNYKGILVLLVLLLTSCAKPDPNLIFIGALSEKLTQTYSEIYIKVVTSNSLTDEELLDFKLMDVKARYLISEFRVLKANDNVSTEDLYGLYKRAKVIYLSGKVLLNKRYNKFPEEIKDVLTRFDIEATNLDRVVTAASDSEFKRKEAMLEIQSFFIAVLKVVIPLLLVA